VGLAAATQLDPIIPQDMLNALWRQPRVKAEDLGDPSVVIDSRPHLSAVQQKDDGG